MIYQALVHRPCLLGQLFPFHDISQSSECPAFLCCSYVAHSLLCVSVLTYSAQYILFPPKHARCSRTGARVRLQEVRSHDVTVFKVVTEENQIKLNKNVLI